MDYSVFPKILLMGLFQKCIALEHISAKTKTYIVQTLFLIYVHFKILRLSKMLYNFQMHLVQFKFQSQFLLKIPPHYTFFCSDLYL